MENQALDKCPNCGTPLKSGIFSSNNILDKSKIDIINECHDKPHTHFCDKCGKGLHEQYKNQLIDERLELAKQLTRLLPYIPVVSIHSPLNWDYDALGLVTGQTTTGTGFASEFTSSFTDLFGTQSKSYNRKLKAGEQLCMGQIRKQTLDLGGNAVVATDIDYSEVGGMKGILMVCMTGTAIRLKNLEVLSVQGIEKIKEIIKLNDRMRQLNKFELSTEGNN